MAETLVLDPIEVSLRRTSFDITPYIDQSGPDFGDAAIEQYLADAQIGQIPVDFKLPNRTITIPLLLTNRGMTFEQLRSSFQQKTGLLQREGGWIKRTTAIGALYADIVGAQLKFGGSTAQALWGIDADAVLTLTVLPDWYGDEIVIPSVSNPQADGELLYTIDAVKGNLPARARLAVQNLSTTDLHGLMWGIRSRNYTPPTALTSALAYECQYMTPIAPATVIANATGDGGFEVKFANSLPTNWTAILTTDLPADGGALTHVGSYRVWARVRTALNTGAPTVISPPKVRLVWDVGDLMNPVENQAVSLPIDPDWWVADLGEIRIDQSPLGTHRWQGVIQAYGSYHGIAVNKLWFQPLDEAAGRISATPGANVGLTGYSARDEFGSDVTAVLTGLSLTVGGVWTFSHGDTDDFTYDGPNFRVKRSTVSDTASRFVYASGPTMTATAAQVDVFIPAMPGGAGTPGNVQGFLMFRRVDASNYGYVSVGHFEDGADPRYRISIGAVVAGTPVPLGTVELPLFEAGWWSLRVAVTAGGYIFAWMYPRGATVPVDATILRYDPTRFATGGALASGKVGFGDGYSGTYAMTRYYDNFIAWVPDTDAVAFGGKGAELRYDGMYREAPTGSAYTAVGTVLGDLFRVPPSGMEGRKAEIFLKGSFGDLEQASDPTLMKLQAQLRYRPSYLFVPEG
jgi:hypothetical protein